jgi:RimJ/RimL family protein N-acetyltransferase
VNDSTSRLLRDIAPLSVSLPDGPDVVLRPLGKEDQERVRRAYTLLSSESRLNRFWEKPAEMSLIRAASLTDTDNLDHVAWGAFSAADPDFPGYAGGSFWRDGENKQRAELAFTVGDDWQRSGFATLLFSILYLEGWRTGVREFFGSCRRQNTAMADWWSSMGGTVLAEPRHFQLSLLLDSPEHFVEKTSFEMPPSLRRVEAAAWIIEWLERLG